MSDGSDAVEGVNKTYPWPNAGDKYSVWQDYYKHVELQRIDDMMGKNHHTGVPFNLIIVLMFFMQQYMEDYQLYNQSSVSNALTNVGNIRNKIEQAFDSYNSDTSQGDSTQAKAALNAYYTDANTITYHGKQITVQGGLVGLLNFYQSKGVFTSDFVSTYESNFVGSSGTVFQKYADSPPSTPPPQSWIDSQASGLTTAWYTDWHPTNPIGSSGTAGNPSTVQPVTNALTAANTQINSLSNTTQSKIKYYESWDEQYKSMMHTVETEIINEEKQSTTAMQSASS